MSTIAPSNTPRSGRFALSAAAGALLAATALAAETPAPTPAAPAPAVAAALTPTPAPPAGPTPCPEQANLLGRLDTLLERRPDDATLHFWKARAWAMCGQAAPSVAALAEVERLGAGFLPVRTAGFERVWDDPAFRTRLAALEAALPRADGAREAFRLRRRDLIPEGIGWDGGAQRLLIGGLASGEILVLGSDGAERRFAGPFEGRPQVLGIAVDAPRRRAYAVVTNAVGRAEGVAPINALLELDADSGALVRRLDAAAAAQLNDVTLAADGTVYVSDTGSGAIWRAAPADTALARWLPDGSLPGANGLALAPGGEALFVGHATGLARVAVADAAITARLANDTRETLAAIDGLYARGDTLLAVQNVTTPGRLVELALDPSGTRVTAVRTLVSHHHPALDEPTTGAVDGDRFLLLAATGIRRLQPDGTIADPATVPDPVVLEVQLGPLPSPAAAPRPADEARPQAAGEDR